MTNHSSEFLRRAAEARQEIVEIDPNELGRAKRTGAALIDVRELHEFQEGHIADAVNVPYEDLPRVIAELLPQKHAPVVVYCNGGNRGALAAQALQKLGYENVSSIAGGFVAYKSHATDSCN